MVWYSDIGLEEGGDGYAVAKKCPVDTFLARGRVLLIFGRRCEPVDENQPIECRIFTKWNSISSKAIKMKKYSFFVIKGIDKTVSLRYNVQVLGRLAQLARASA